MFVRKKKYDELQGECNQLQKRIKALESAEYVHSVRVNAKTKEIYKLNGKVLELETKLREKEAVCKQLLTENAELKVKYTKTAYKNFEYVYFVSYYFTTHDYGSGVGSAVCDSKKEIKTDEGVADIREKLMNQQNLKDVTLLSFQLMGVRKAQEDDR